jgi:dihydropteroate synthase
VIEQLAHGPVPLSIDTRHPQVMKAALAAGASLVNDVNGLRAPGALEVCAEARAAVCIMHMQGDPQTMQLNPTYNHVVSEVAEFLQGQAQKALDLGILPQSIMLDPGFGFGKTVAHNLQLLRHLDQLAALGYPVLAGLSRKSVLGAIAGGKPSDRLVPSIVAGLAAVERGAWMLRVHDVKATLEALNVWQEIEEEALGA